MGKMIRNSTLNEQLSTFNRRQSEIAIEQARATHSGSNPLKMDIRRKFKNMLDSQVRATRASDNSSVVIDYLMAIVAIVILLIGSFIYVSVRTDKSTLPTFSPTKINYDKDRDV